MANDGRVSGSLLFPEYVLEDDGVVSSVLLFPEYTLTSLGHVSSVLLFPEYTLTFVGHASAVFLMVEYSQSPANTPLVQGAEQLEMIQFQGSELALGPGQVT